MTAAAGTQRFYPHHAVRYVSDSGDMCLIDRCPERGPAGTALELGLVLEKGQGAEAAAVEARVFLIEQTTTEGRFGPVVQKNLCLLSGEVSFEALAFLSVRRRERKSGWGDRWRAHSSQSSVTLCRVEDGSPIEMMIAAWPKVVEGAIVWTPGANTSAGVAGKLGE